MSRFKALSNPNYRAKLLVLLVIVGIVSVLVSGNAFQPVYGNRMQNRTLLVGDNQAGKVTDYKLGFTTTSNGTIGSIAVQFCSNDPLPGTPCTAPTGFSVSSSVLATQAGLTGFSIDSSSTANRYLLTRTPSFETANTTATFEFTGVLNPSVPGSYYVRVQTYASTDASGVNDDFGGIAFDINTGLALTAEVPPYLIFCTGVTITGLNCVNASGDYIDFGELSSKSVRYGSSQMLIASNAVDGYYVSVAGATMSSGNNIISALTNPDVSRPGTGQFGLNLVPNSTPSVGQAPFGPGIISATTAYQQPNFYVFNSGDTIISQPVPSDIKQYTASYIVNVPATQEPGIYVSTLTYICLASF